MPTNESMPSPNISSCCFSCSLAGLKLARKTELARRLVSVSLSVPLTKPVSRCRCKSRRSHGFSHVIVDRFAVGQGAGTSVAESTALSRTERKLKGGFPEENEKAPVFKGAMMGDEGLEPPTFSM